MQNKTTVSAATQHNDAKVARPMLLRMARRRRQSGELSMIEGAGIMAAAAVLAIAAIAGGKYVYDRVQAGRFKAEAQFFHSGVLDATANDVDYSTESLTSLAQNHAFDAAGSRVASDHSTVRGLFGGNVTVSLGSMSATDDSVIINYPVPNTICTLAMPAVVAAYPMVTVNGTTVSGPSTTFDGSTAGAACGGGTATVAMYVTKN
ncbi:type 4 pilus major pilin [Paraburkholderia hospita]|uniref:type 4 pilus major pilin n=1 Tax=Paraburkholderia hospita TaxID=169430 RepID=UPI0008A7C8FC|nr:type 4 pilus major pilin [Paraburkholderia hospita]SEI23749.1 PilS N terminal [Paraburkholderia hospita]